MQPIYKILTPLEWERFQKDKIFRGSPLDLEDGFIHCSFESQYPGVLKRYFADQRPLVLLTIDPNRLQQHSLKVEAYTPGGEGYPHVYAALSLDAVVAWNFL
jgi:uncharacterized protein (DUF952 family)